MKKEKKEGFLKKLLTKKDPKIDYSIPLSEKEHKKVFKKFNPLDKDLKYPPEYIGSRKDIYKLIRQMFEIPENESIEQQFEYFTSLNKIEEELFGSIKDREKEFPFFPMRLYVTHNNQDTLKKKILGYFAKVTQEVGTAHLAIQVSDNILHWFNSSLVFIKEWKGTKATALFYPQSKDGKEVALIENTKENRLKICKVILEWNCVRCYDQLNNNCQKFATAIFESIDLNGNFSEYDGWAGEFIRYIAMKNSDVNPCLVKEGKILVEWKDHEELDNWHNENQTTFPEAASLLKAMHRAFQLRGDPGKQCLHDSPTLIVTSGGKKVPVDPNSNYNSFLDSFVPMNSSNRVTTTSFN